MYAFCVSLESQVESEEVLLITSAETLMGFIHRVELAEQAQRGEFGTEDVHSLAHLLNSDLFTGIIAVVLLDSCDLCGCHHFRVP